MSAQLYPSDGEVTKVKKTNKQLQIVADCREKICNLLFAFSVDGRHSILPQYGSQIDHAVDEDHTVFHVGENGHRVVTRLDLEYKCIYRVQYQDADQ